jgi:hypothetical protein
MKRDMDGGLGICRRRVRGLAWLGAFGALVSSCHPCEDLNRRLCADLGADCSVWEDTSSIIIPSPRWRMRGRRITPAFLTQEASTCRSYAARSNYESRTLPLARFLVRKQTYPASADLAPPMPSAAADPWTRREVVWLGFGSIGVAVLVYALRMRAR